MQLGSINSFAVRTVRFTECIAEAHRLGHGPGPHARPWSLDFQRRAAPVYAEAFPAAYRRGIADASKLVANYMANYMEGATVPEPTATEWSIITEFLHTTSKALSEASDVASLNPEAGRASISGTLPAVLRYELFAELLNVQGVTLLQSAAMAVVSFCQANLPATPNAIELEWIISLANRVPVEELAERYNLSARNMYRRLESMWKHLGVGSQVQGVALAVQHGWIALPPTSGQESADQENERG